MERDFPFQATTALSARRLGPTLAIVGALLAGCGPRPQETEPAPVATTPSLAVATATETSGLVATNEEMDYCFVYPEGFTLQTNDGQMEVVGPYSPPGPEPGLAWVDVADAQGRSADQVAEEEVNAFGGNPPRYTVMLGGEEALVLDGMPGQDPVRKVYIVHGGRLYTLTFSPYLSENEAANAQMETLYASVTSSWVWISSGGTCGGGG